MDTNNSNNITQFDQPEEKPPIRPTRKKSRLKYLIPVVMLVVIVFAFVMEMRANQEVEALEAEPVPETKSAVQLEIEGLDWIEQNLLPINRFSRPGILLDAVNGIVIHNIGNPNTTALQNRNFFASLAEREDIFASSNFIVCLDGSIIQCVPVDEVAYASNHRNNDTLSIEVCHPDDTGRFTRESYVAAVQLTAWLCVRFGLTADDVIRHYDVQGKECPRYFVVNEDEWEAFKAEVTLEIRRISG